MANEQTQQVNDTVKVSKTAIEFTRSVKDKDWIDECAKVERSLLATVKVPGFRPGKAPAEKARQYVSKNQVIDRVLSKIVADMHQKATNSEEVKKARLFAAPRPSIQEINDNGVTLLLTFDLAPEITLKKYKGLKVDIQKAKATDEEVDQEIDRIVSKQSMSTLKEGPIATGDIAVIDFEGFMDDKPFAGGKADDHELKIGSKSFIPGFEDQLIGLKAGEKKDVKVPFPKEYHAKELAGKDAVFKVHVKKVKELQKAELNDHLVSSFDIPEVKTVEAFKNYVREQLVQQKQLNLDSAANTAILKALEEQIEASLPLSVIQSEENKLMEGFNKELKERKLTMEEYLKREKTTAEALHERMHRDAERNVKLSLALQEVVVKEKLDISNEEVDEHLKKVGKLYNMPVEEIKKIITDLSQIRTQLLNEKVFKFLRDHAVSTQNV